MNPLAPVTTTFIVDKPSPIGRSASNDSLMARPCCARQGDAVVKIALVHPPITLTNPKRLPQIQPPLGIAYLAACLRERRYDVQVVDGLGEGIGSYSRFREDYYIHGLAIKDVADRIDPATNVIGVGIMFSNFWPLSKALIKELRGRFSDAIIVCGGEHVTALPEFVLADAPVDYAVIGEGEETFLELLAFLENPTTSPRPAEIAGLSFREPDGTILRTPPRQRRRKLDELPWPAWDLFPLEKYLDTRLFFSMPFQRSQRPMVILATRGCPYTCKFCSNEQMWGTNFFMRDPRCVVDEMEHYVVEYGATDFHFQDLTLVINARWTERLCDEIIRRDLGITWKTASGTRCEALDLPLLQKMQRSGCDEIVLAPDSGSERIIAINRKRVDLDEVLAVAQLIRDHRVPMRVTGLMIVGYPEETVADVFRSWGYLVRMARAGFSTVYVNRFTAYPGSEYHDIAVADGRIVHDDTYFLDLERNFGLLNSGVSWHPRWSGRFVLLLWLLAYVAFFGTFYLSKPAEVVRGLSAVLRNRPRTRFERFFAFLLWQPLGRRGAEGGLSSGTAPAPETNA
jgi:radical SAM superfamily enzyme YgiQ (UPF0313 family)